MTRTVQEPDVVVVGARLAGAATALLLAQRGHDVLMIDRATFPSDTVSTHAMTRGGVVQLARWGVLARVLASGAPCLSTVSFQFQGEEIRHDVGGDPGTDFVIAPRRHVLDALMVEAAQKAGARTRFGITASGVHEDDSGRVQGITARSASGDELEIPARFVVGADGARSRLARLTGAPIQEEHVSHSAHFYTYVAGLELDALEFHIGENTISGVFPTHDEQACVWTWHHADRATAANSARGATFLDEIATEFPDLGSRLNRGRVTSKVRGKARLPNVVREPVGPGWALVGDAGYCRDSVAGNGMTDALRDAEFLADALDEHLRGMADDAELAKSYGTRRDMALREIFDITCALSSTVEPLQFLHVQRQLGEALEAEARQLSALAIPN